MNFSELRKRIKVRQWGKYVVVIALFLVVYLFIGDQSMIQFAKRGREIQRLEEQRDMYREGAEKAEHEIRILNQTDSLERYAREHYFMHEKGEEIYLVEEEE